MLKEGNIVTYSTSGVCRVSASVTQRVGGQERKYYCLVPFDKLSSRILVPADNDKLIEKIRSVPDAVYFKELFDNPERYLLEWQENDIERNKEFSLIIEEGSFDRVLGVIGCIVKKKAELYLLSRRLKNPDSNTLRVAERMFCSCVSAVFEISFEEAVERTENAFS